MNTTNEKNSIVEFVIPDAKIKLFIVNILVIPKIVKKLNGTKLNY